MKEAEISALSPTQIPKALSRTPNLKQKETLRKDLAKERLHFDLVHSLVMEARAQRPDLDK